MQAIVVGEPTKWAKWGRSLAFFRKIRGYSSQRAFADALGVSKSAVQFWESGKVAPRDEMKTRIAHALNIEPGLLFPLEASR